MRELHADRADSEGAFIFVMDLDSGEEFQIPIDNTLRTLVHPPEPIEPDEPAEPDPEDAPAVEAPPALTLTPREIQARVRSGATVEELSEATGVGVDKINRFAHPVILERSRAAELARASHPMGVDGPVAGTLGEIVAECLVLRGNSPQNAEWDAWRTEAGQWVVQVSPDPDADSFAHWRFTPGAHGGTTDPMDDLAVELTEPELARTVRRPAVVAVPEPPTREVTEDGHEYVTVNADDLTGEQTHRQDPFGEVLDLRYRDERPVEGPAAQEDSDSTPRHRSKRAKPTVPAWEDVLLGVRSHPNE
ncbi:septation protein SepH [Gordonia neofelifaecis]|uniref:DUF3071 domain-containing protein n=1 Tax=Gordonia neofelifaecis NRRL B-59395 TaxID=644548 RepID=F1YLW8_9ACTN|nr:septation protein SepH [Gordonia neofelifaecis]EGD54219.1 hypothetical protein SCNU_14561 [Gordonia neofelifaecis NRRL B-59395]